MAHRDLPTSPPDSSTPRLPDPGTYSRALDMLARAPRSARDLRRRLLLKGEAEVDVDATIARLTAAGLLDDAAFALAFVRSKVSSQGFSRRRLRLELAKRGVAREIAASAVAEVFTDEQVDETTMLEQLVTKKLRSLASLDHATRERRLYAYLSRRGHDPEQIRLSLRRLSASADE